MFDKQRLKRLLSLHEMAFGLFRWLNGSLREGKRSLKAIQEPLTFSEAARAWLLANRAQLPSEFRPEDTDLDEFAHLFASYLSTSFEVVDDLKVSCGGCWCCAYWVDLPRHLRVRNPDQKARAMAHQLKVLVLGRLAEECELAMTEPELEEFVNGYRDLDAPLSLATYVHELSRRSHFASQGEGVLALWRDIAWKDGRPNPKFHLTVERVLEAEQIVKDGLEKQAASGTLERRVYELDGGRIRSLEDFYVQIGEAINGPGGYFGNNLDALNDCLSGGFGTPEGPYVIRWTRSKDSRKALGYPETVRYLEAVLKTCHRSNRKSVQRKLTMAKNGIGQTVYELLVEVICSAKNVELRLE